MVLGNKITGIYINFCMKTIYLLLFICGVSEAKSQKMKESYFGTWINVDLNERLNSNQPFDSTVNITPRFLYIDNSKAIKINKRFEQGQIQYEIKKIANDRLYIKGGQIKVQNDTLSLIVGRLKNIKFVRYKKL